VGLFLIFQEEMLRPFGICPRPFHLHFIFDDFGGIFSVWANLRIRCADYLLISSFFLVPPKATEKKIIFLEISRQS